MRYPGCGSYIHPRPVRCGDGRSRIGDETYSEVKRLIEVRNTLLLRLLSGQDWWWDNSNVVLTASISSICSTNQAILENHSIDWILQHEAWNQDKGAGDVPKPSDLPNVYRKELVATGRNGIGGGKGGVMKIKVTDFHSNILLMARRIITT